MINIVTWSTITDFLSVVWSIITALFSAALTPLIAIIAVYIAYRQYKTDNHKLRLDLYEKRFKVYQSVMELLSSILQKADVSLEEVTQFSIKTNESRFLFESEIPDYIETIRKNAIKLHFLENKIKQKTTIDVSKMEKEVQESSDLIDWFEKQFETTNDLFMSYLLFKRI